MRSGSGASRSWARRRGGRATPPRSVPLARAPRAPVRARRHERPPCMCRVARGLPATSGLILTTIYGTKCNFSSIDV